MFENIEYDNFPFIISSGSDFTYEINCIKNEILPSFKSRFDQKKHFSLNFYDLIYPNEKRENVQTNSINNFVLINLDSINQNGSICICLLGERFENERLDGESSSFKESITESMKSASDSGYFWISETIQDSDPSLVEVLSLYGGLMSGVKYPLFYFRVCGGPISEDRQNFIMDNIDNPNARMERLKQKLIRNGLPIKFYGSAAEFKEAFEADLMKVFVNFPDKTLETDSITVDQHCFEDDRTKVFTFNDNIMRVFNDLESIYNSLLSWEPSNDPPPATVRIDELIEDFCRKEFSDKLISTYRKISLRSSSQMSFNQENKILVLSGPRGSGKSTILVNWLSSKKENQKMFYVVHYCEASFPSSNLHFMLRRIIKQIRFLCNYTFEQDNYEMNSLEMDLMSLSQELLGAMLLAKQNGKRLLILIDGLDQLGDKFASSSKQIKFTEWIPQIIPNNVRIIISCPASDSSFIQLKEKRSDLMVIEIIPESEDDLLSLTQSGIHGFQTWISKYNQTIPDDTLQYIEEWPLIRNPLVQKIMAQMYHNIGITSFWTTFIEKISECQTLVEVLKRSMKIYIRFLNWEIIVKSEKKLKKKYSQKKEENVIESSVQGWIPDCLSLLVLSRNGLNIDIILSSLYYLGYVKDLQVSQSNLWSLFHFTRDTMLKFHDNRFKFSHSICKEIVEHTFLAIASCSSMEARTHECKDSIYIDKRCKLHILLAYNLWNRRTEDKDNLSECLYHLDRASDHDSLEKLMFIPSVLLKIFDLDIETLRTWAGQIANSSRFQYYWSILSNQGCDFVANFKRLLSYYCDIEFESEEEPSNSIADQSLSPTRIEHPKKIHFQSDFAKKLVIHINEPKEKDLLSAWSHDQRARFLLLLAQICVLVKHKSLARKLFNHLEQLSLDNIVLCHVLWMDIQLDSSFNSVSDNITYVKSSLERLDELTKDILEEETDIPVHLVERIKYLRSLCLVLKYSLQLSVSRSSLFPADYIELQTCSKDLRSIILMSIVKEFEYDSIEVSEDTHAIQEKLLLLSNIIVMLETWTGPVHSRMASLFVKLALIFKCGNTQSKLKAEACCRRALWIWKTLNNKMEDFYNSEESECTEILFTILLENPCQSSLNEARNHIYSTFDNRMRHLGCYDPLTTRLVPVLKSVNSLQSYYSSHSKLEPKTSLVRSSQKSDKLPLSNSKNQSNVRANKLIIDGTEERRNIKSASSINERMRPSHLSSLQFINRYSSKSDCFSEDIDWDAEMSSRPCSKSASRMTSAGSKKQSAMSFRLNIIPTRCSSISIGSDKLAYTYLGHDSSIASLSERYNIRDKLASKNEKQVRFDNLNPSIRQTASPGEINKIIRKKLQDMKSVECPPNVLRKRSLSANFSRPYSSIIDSTV